MQASKTALSLKRKQPGDMPPQPAPRKINILSDVVVSPAVAQPQGLGAAINGGDGNQQVVDLGLPHRPSSPPVLQLSERDFEPLNLEVMGILEELERATKSPKLEKQPSGSQITCGSEAGPSNLGNNDGEDSLQYSIPFVPPLLSPLPYDDDNVKIISDNNRPSSSANMERERQPGVPKKKQVRFKLPLSSKTDKNKKGGSNKNASLLKDALERPGCSSSKGEKNKKTHKDSSESDFDCFSQREERDVLRETAKIYKKAKEACAKEQKAIEETAAEIKKIKEKLAKLEEKMNFHRRNFDKAKRKLKAVETIFGK